MALNSAEKVVDGTNLGHDAEASTSLVMSTINEIIYSPMNMALVVIIGFLVYKIIKDHIEVPGAGVVKPPEPQLPKLRRDFTIAELRQYDGTQPDGRVLLAINGFVYDVTKGKHFYGPGGPYATFAGRDASRNLATFDVAVNDKDEYDDLSDLSPMQMDSVHEWELQFKEKYDLVGKLLRNGEQPTNYEDEEEDTVADATPTPTTNSTPPNTSTPITANTDDNDDADADAEGIRNRAAPTAT